MRRNLALWERALFTVAGAFLFFHVGWMKIAGTALLAVGLAYPYLYEAGGGCPAAEI